ncbi:MAG: DUF899 family protein [Pseudonocardiaceae bacterium]
MVDRATWQAERDALLVREKAHTREGDAIAAARRRLPMERPLPRLHGLGRALVLGARLRRRPARRAFDSPCWCATCGTATGCSRPTGPAAAASRRWPPATTCWT